MLRGEDVEDGLNLTAEECRRIRSLVPHNVVDATGLLKSLRRFGIKAVRAGEIIAAITATQARVVREHIKIAATCAQCTNPECALYPNCEAITFVITYKTTARGVRAFFRPTKDILAALGIDSLDGVTMYGTWCQKSRTVTYLASMAWELRGYPQKQIPADLN